MIHSCNITYQSAHRKMNTPAQSSGTNPNATTDSIVAEELLKLKQYRSRVTEENDKFVAEHPELRAVVDDFVTAIIQQKPTDLVKFGAFYFTNLQKNGKIGPCPVVIAGPSGVGKGTIIAKLLEKFPDHFGFSVSHTTRAPRPGEENGVHYNFVSKGEFEEAVERGEFVEHAKVHLNYYGTSFHAIEKVRSQNKICVLDIDIQGVQSVKKSKLDCKTMFIMPPSIKDLEARLTARGTETLEKVKVRLENAVGEIAYARAEGNFGAIITNDDFDRAFEEVVTTLQRWFPELDLYLGK